MTRFLRLSCIATAVLVCGACGDDRSPVAPAPPPPPPPPPAATLSGFVRDDNGSPIANHEVTLEQFFTGNKQAMTSTNVDGYYEMFLGSTTASSYGGSFIHAGGGEYEPHYVEALVGIVQNLRLRRLPTVEAGQSTVISIDRESSLAVDGGDWWVRDEVWETLEVRVAEAGAVIVNARLEVSGIVPSLMVIKRCDDGNCFTDWIRDSGILSVWVKATSRVEIRIAIPTASAPQRVEVTTSLQR
jgi:hypothetical protein